MDETSLVFMDLPVEIHLNISKHLDYPDALALKHTCRGFYSIVDTGVQKKVDWLVDRFERRLECPMERCSFLTDEAFCNPRMKRIMERRRRHLECPRGVNGGCLVVEGNTCQMDLVPIWLKRQSRLGVIGIVAFWGNEGESPIERSFFPFLPPCSIIYLCVLDGLVNENPVCPLSSPCRRLVLSSHKSP